MKLKEKTKTIIEKALSLFDKALSGLTTLAAVVGVAVFDDPADNFGEGILRAILVGVICGLVSVCIRRIIRKCLAALKDEKKGQEDNLNKPRTGTQ